MGRHAALCGVETRDHAVGGGGGGGGGGGTAGAAGAGAAVAAHLCVCVGGEVVREPPPEGSRSIWLYT